MNNHAGYRQENIGRKKNCLKDIIEFPLTRGCYTAKTMKMNFGKLKVPAAVIYSGGERV